LGTSTAWAQANEDRLEKTVFVGGDASRGQVYGYTAWNGNQGFLCIRNPDRQMQQLTVPFDRHVYYRGDMGKAFHARAIYPFVEEMPWKLTSGKSFSMDVPGDSVMVFYLDAGSPKVTQAVTPEPLPETKVKRNPDSFEFTVPVPDEEFKRFELLITDFHDEKAMITVKKKIRAINIFPKLQLTIDGSEVKVSRSLNGTGWELSAIDLRKYRGKTIKIRAQFIAIEGIKKGETNMDAWLVVDRKVNCPKPVLDKDEKLPWAISQNYRRLTRKLLPTEKIGF
jgi:hypothetical protein